MGTLRFILAILVLLSHSGVSVAGLNPGVMAVVGFYVISGYVMAALIQRHYAEPHTTLRFYGDRLLRIYPQYAVYALATAAWLFTIGHSTHFLTLSPTATEVLNNLFIVPLNYYMYNQSDRFTLVPPAWSLGAELLFYALAPWLWRHWRWALLLGAGSLFTQALAWHGTINADWWGYRLLPGVLWLFLLGMALNRYQPTHPESTHRAVRMLPLLVAAVAIYLQLNGHLQQPYHREVLLGLCVCLPLVHWLSRQSIGPRLASADTALGNASYGIFLNHFLLIWMLGLEQPRHLHQWLTLVLSSIALAVITQYLFERPVLQLRRNWRKKDQNHLK